MQLEAHHAGRGSAKNKQGSKAAQLLQWTDFGGKKREGHDATAWATAVRECKEESGMDMGSCTIGAPPCYHPESCGKHVLFWVKLPPGGGERLLSPPEGARTQQQHMVEHRRFTQWPKTAAVVNGRAVVLHPRLLYDKGALIYRARVSLGFSA